MGSQPIQTQPALTGSYFPHDPFKFVGVGRAASLFPRRSPLGPRGCSYCCMHCGTPGSWISSSPTAPGRFIMEPGSVKLTSPVSLIQYSFIRSPLLIPLDLSSHPFDHISKRCPKTVMPATSVVQRWDQRAATQVLRRSVTETDVPYVTQIWRGLANGLGWQKVEDLYRVDHALCLDERRHDSLDWTCVSVSKSSYE